MKDKIIVFSFLVYIFFFTIAHIVIPDEDISSVERRSLAHFPKVELNNQYITKIDEYLLDHFPFRNQFRSIKAKFNYNILNKLDNNNIYLANNYIFKSEYPTNKDSIQNFVNKTDKLMKLLSPNNKAYMLIVPDKNYYLNSDNFLQIDYDYLYDVIDNIEVEHIDIRDIMELSDYYETDTHWRQEKIDKVIQALDKKLNFNYQHYDYDINTYDKFYGVYYGESAINRKPETLSYLTNSIIEKVEVKYLENESLHTVYNLDKLNGYDAYEVYLDGASAFIEIYNDACTNNRELVIFRDSFGSSITPLLIPFYSKITVIDNRYITSDYILDYVNFDNQDVLFLYSTLIVNNSGSLKG